MKRTVYQILERLLDRKSTSCLRRRLIPALILLAIAMSTAAEAGCWDDSLKQVDRDILVMDSEAVYQVLPDDEMTSVFWLPPAHITICDSIVDVAGTAMMYYRIHNWDNAVQVWATRER